MTVRLVADAASYEWGDDITVRYEGDPADFEATGDLTGTVRLAGNTAEVQGAVTFQAAFDEPRLAGYDFVQADADPRVWVGRPA